MPHDGRVNNFAQLEFINAPPKLDTLLPRFKVPRKQRRACKQYMLTAYC